MSYRKIQDVSQKDSEMNLAAQITGFRHLVMAQTQTTMADSLADGINSFWTQLVANGGTIASTLGEGQLKTSTAVNGSAKLTSATINYYPGQANWMNGVLRFGDTGVAGNIRRVGLFTTSGDTPQEGFYYELDGTSFYAVTVKAGVATRVLSTAFSKFSTAPYTHDGNYSGYEIRYSGNTVWFYIGGVLRHSVTGTSTPLTTTLNLPITLQNIKTSGATDVTFAIRNIGVGSYGSPSGRVEETGHMSTPAQAVGGGTPHDSVDSGNPIKMGGKASTAVPAAVQDGDRANTWVNNNGAQATFTVPHTAGGLSVYRVVSAATTNAAIIKASAGQVFGWYIYNSNAAARKVILYNSATAPTVGTTAAFMTIVIPGGSGANVEYTNGIAFSAGISIGTSTGLADTDATAVAATDLIINIMYK